MRQPQARQCITELEGNLVVKQGDVPIGALAGAASRLRSTDIFALVTSVDRLDGTHTGFLERSANGVQAIHAGPDHRVIRSQDFVGYAANVEDVIGVSILSPLPTAPGQP